MVGRAEVRSEKLEVRRSCNFTLISRNLRYRVLAFILASNFYLLTSALPASAQFLGYTSPQTVGPITCINAAVGPATSSAVPGAASFIPALGQSVHYLTYTTVGTINTMSIQLDASFNNATFFRVSETATTPGSGAVSANVYYPFMRCNLTAVTGGGSVTATYTGTSVSSGPPSGIFNSSGIFTKVLATATIASSNATYNFTFPAGNTGGTLYFTKTNTILGSTLTVSGGPDTSHLATISTFDLTSDTVQVFKIPSRAATAGRILFTQVGLNLGTYDLIYNFSGTSDTSTTLTANPIDALPTICNKQARISLTAAGNTLGLAGITGKVIAICHISMASSAMADISFVRDPAANCAGGPTTFWGPYEDVITVVLDFGISPLIVPVSQSFCINQSAAVTTGGGFTYAQF